MKVHSKIKIIEKLKTGAIITHEKRKRKNKVGKPQR